MMTIPPEIMLQILNNEPDLELINNLCLTDSQLKEMVYHDIDNIKSTKITTALNISRLNGLKNVNAIIEIKDNNDLIMVANMPKLKKTLFDLSKYFRSRYIFSNKINRNDITFFNYYCDSCLEFIKQYNQGFCKKDDRVVKNNRSLNNCLFYFIDTFTRSCPNICGIGSSHLIIKQCNPGNYQTQMKGAYELLENLIVAANINLKDIKYLYTSLADFYQFNLPNLNTLVIDMRIST